MQTLVLIRGMPGSGKSTMAKALTGFCHYEADQYFQTKDGYDFDKALIKTAHKKCQYNTRNALQDGYSVVVSNTFTQHWEMQPYWDMAKEFNIPCHEMTCHGNFQNVHNVPQSVIEAMQNRWEI